MAISKTKKNEKVELLASELADSTTAIIGTFSKLTVAKVDIDNNPMSPNQFAVRGIPTLILFKDGKR